MTSIKSLLKDLENDFSIDKFFETKNIIKDKWEESLESLRADYEEFHSHLMNEDISICTLNKFLDLLNQDYDKHFKQTNTIYKNYLNKLDLIYYNWKIKN